MLLKEIIDIYSENHLNHTYILNVKFRVFFYKVTEGGTHSYHCALKG